MATSPRRTPSIPVVDLRSLPPDALLTSPEVAALRGTTDATLRNERTRGRSIPYIKQGRAVRYRVSDVLEALDRATVRSGDLEADHEA